MAGTPVQWLAVRSSSLKGGLKMLLSAQQLVLVGFASLVRLRWTYYNNHLSNISKIYLI